MNFYNISQEPTRHQLAQHYHSSLQEPNLQNVESQLYVTRQRNYQLAQQYFQNKYGNAELYNKYVENNNLSGLGPPAEPQYDFKRQLDKKALAIQQEQTRKIRQKKAGRTNPNEQAQYDVKEYKISNKRGKDRENLWSRQVNNKQNKQQKLQIIQKQPEYQINIDNEKQGAFISQFKNYLSNKKKLKEETKEVKKVQLDQSLTISQFKGTGSSFSPMKSLNKSQDNQFKYQEELAKKIIKDISGQVGPYVSVEKIQIVEYINSNKKILKVLNSSSEEVTKAIMTFNTKDSNKMTYNECIMYILQAFGKMEYAKKLRAKEEFQIVPQGCMLSPEVLGIFQSTFRGMDQYNDLIIKRILYISKLTGDPLVKKSLNLPAVFEPEYNRHVSLRRIFERIEMQTLLCSQQQKKLNQYISWSQFIKYFQSGHKKRAKYDLITLLQSLRNQQKFGLHLLQDSILQIINWALKRADKGQQLLQTIQIINQIKMHREYQIQKYSSIKTTEDDDQNDSDLTFQDILSNIKEKGLKYVTPKEFMEYFSLKGKPVEEFQKQRNQKLNKNLSAVRVSFVQKEHFEPKQDLNGYDSDPEVYNNSKIYDKNVSQLRKSQKQLKKFKLTGKSFVEKEEENDNMNVQEHGHYANIKVTIPKPFSFEQRQKYRKNAKKAQSIKDEHRVSFKAAPVPAKVTEIGLYEKMLEDQHKKNEQRKRCSMIMTLANQKPFSFQNRKTNKKTKDERQQFIFKAEPIPWFCSVNLLQKKKEEQILRNERIAKMAQQKLAKSKLPPRMEKDYLEKEAMKAIQQKQPKKSSANQIKVKQPPNFEKIHKQFQQALQRKKKDNKNTQVKEFRFASTSKPAKNTKSQVYPEFYESKRYQIPASHAADIDIFAQSTAKFNQQVQKRRKQAQEKRKLQVKKLKQEQERLKVDAELKKKVQDAARRKDQNKQKQLQKRKQEQTQQNQKSKALREQCIEKGRKQPMLVERISKRDEKIDKMKKLYDISQTLKKNGIQGKDHDHYFKRQELLLLEDYKSLKDKL